MSEKFKGKYRNESARLPDLDYGSNAAYFITICTHDRQHYFGEIVDGKIQLSPAGAIAHVLWCEIKNHTRNVELGEFVVMPNHVHGILILNGDDNKTIDCGDGNGTAGDRRAVACNGPTINDPATDNYPATDNGLGTGNQTKNQRMSEISPKAGTVSAIIRSYKSAVTGYCNLLGLQFAWQSRFHDHIIRNDETFYRISVYIKNNPANWCTDRFRESENSTGNNADSNS